MPEDIPSLEGIWAMGEVGGPAGPNLEKKTAGIAVQGRTVGSGDQ